MTIVVAGSVYEVLFAREVTIPFKYIIRRGGVFWGKYVDYEQKQ